MGVQYMKTKEKLKAIELRKQGKSINDISNILNVSKGSVSSWVRDIILDEIYINNFKLKQQRNRLKGSVAIKEKYSKMREGYRKEGFELAKNNNEFRILCALYWGEGTKNKNSFKLTNCDSSMISLVNNLIKPYNPYLCIYFYKENGLSDEEIRKWWYDATKIKEIKLYVQKISRASQNKLKNKQMYGTATIQVDKTELVQKIYGGIEYLKSMGV